MEGLNLFEYAVREKLRFPYRGGISVEDLWDLSPENLDKVYRELMVEKKQTQEESLLNTKTKASKELDIKVEMVKHIVYVKLEEQEKRKNAKKKAEERQKIASILVQKQDAELAAKSTEELQQMLKEMDEEE